ncbi:hypothetical protein [Lactococcus lactis]|nr:hypothetical protein [Lactococcus lactis]KST97269.1 hypothetical protein KF146_0707 [Lactococcus lactis subsp. lactis]MCT0033069.1 hypothetical protein [Lactococcus lactis subsp. lactis]MDT2860637.1 hypothetical protein [Lactococcus lactis]MDT2867080.1 hypothetical protein [Lactococcus lactis]MDT2871810.1 hypothetical protein [Lactococcus lactis]
MTWTEQSKESLSKQWLNPFLVLDYKNEIIGVYRNSKQCERESEFGFSSLGIRQALNKIHKTHKGFRFKKISIELYKEYIGEE